MPFDGYVSELHEDEAVLTAPEAAVWRRMKAGGFAMAGSGHGAPLTNIGQVNISTYGEAPDELARLVARRFRDQSIGGGMFGG
ncbi:MAG: hypothetical protein IPM16_06740 [Chloroflexi bacterium]|nr:hypothetical protein [Chloroflexota bacterium]